MWLYNTSPPVPIPILWWLYRARQLQLISPSVSCSICFFQFFSKVLVFIFLFTFLQLYHVANRNDKDNYSEGYCFLFWFFFCWQSLGPVVCPRLDNPFLSQNPRESCASYFLGRIPGCAYIICPYAQFLHNSQWITLSTQSRLVLYSLCTNLLHSLIMWLIVSFLSPHNLHLLFCCVFSVLAWTLLILMVLFCVTIKRDSVSLLRFPFLSHVQVFSCEISFVCLFKCP